MLHIIWSILVGFIVGFIAKLFIHTDIHGFWMTALIGIAGSIVGGLIGRVISPPKPGQAVHPAGLILSVIGAAIVLFVAGKFM